MLGVFPVFADVETDQLISSELNPERLGMQPVSPWAPFYLFEPDRHEIDVTTNADV